MLLRREGWSNRCIYMIWSNELGVFIECTWNTISAKSLYYSLLGNRRWKLLFHSTISKLNYHLCKIIILVACEGEWNFILPISCERGNNFNIIFFLLPSSFHQPFNLIIQCNLAIWTNCDVSEQSVKWEMCDWHRYHGYYICKKDRIVYL